MGCRGDRSGDAKKVLVSAKWLVGLRGIITQKVLLRDMGASGVGGLMGLLGGGRLLRRRISGFAHGDVSKKEVLLNGYWLEMMRYNLVRQSG